MTEIINFITIVQIKKNFSNVPVLLCYFSQLKGPQPPVPNWWKKPTEVS